MNVVIFFVSSQVSLFQVFLCMLSSLIRRSVIVYFECESVMWVVLKRCVNKSNQSRDRWDQIRHCECYLEVLALGPAQLLQVEVEHGGEPVHQLQPQERLLDLHRQVLQHVHRLSGGTEKSEHYFTGLNHDKVTSSSANSKLREHKLFFLNNPNLLSW